LLASAGILAVAVGFAAQSALGNLIGGVFIVIFKPFKLGDRVEIQNLRGIVEDITLRHTVIRDFQNRHIVIPNSVISSENIVNANLGDDRICQWVDIGISYGSDIRLAREIMRDEVMKHPFHIDGRTPEQVANGIDEVPVRVIALADFSINLRAWAWAQGPAEAFQMQCELLESIKVRFDAEGVEIPFPYRTVVYKNDLPEEARLDDTSSEHS
jgi:small-conductance mechanosensitive channel